MRLALIAFAFVFGLAACASAQEGPQPTLPQSTLVIETAKGAKQFTVELAYSWPEQERGLMFRERVAPNEGMLFDFHKESQQAFWMKNTLIPLDMLFIRADGRIAHIAAQTKPLTTDEVPSMVPVQAVLEIAGGRAAELGIKEGDRVRHRIFGNELH
jgi:uncharacterized membrane protein (UPF0127 family)